MLKTAILIFSMTLVVVGFQNCGQPQNLSLDTDLNPNSKTDGDDSGSEYRVRIQPGSEKAKCYQDNLQLSGLCQVPEADQSIVEFTLAKDGQPVFWVGNTQKISVYCDNGSFIVIIPRPVWGGFTSARDQVKFQLRSELKTRKVGSLTFDSVARESRDIFFEGNLGPDCAGN